MAKKDPAEMLGEHLMKQIYGWAIEWNLDKYTIIGVLEDIKAEFVWGENDLSCMPGEEEEDDDDDDDDL